jgi:tRNA dimethylallyltransferase
LRWAETMGAEIVSCDSLLFYRGMDIGTAKPTELERSRVAHHLIDVCAVTDRMDIAHYVKKARVAVEEIAGRGRAVLVTGGSGFYLKSFFAPVADEIVVPEALRTEVGGMTPTAALAWLMRLNPDGLGEMDVANPRRVIRALERCLASGKTMAVLAAEFARLPGAFADWEAKIIRLDRAQADLEKRIEARVAAMMQQGLVDEVRRLRDQGFERNPSAALAIGYREVLAVLDGRMPAAQLTAEVCRNTRALVKKQRTWFRTQLPEHRVVAAENLHHTGDLLAAC